MSAAILQGVPATTLDTDIWVELRPREYVRVLKLCQRIGASLLAQTVVALQDDTLVNFLYRVDGLRSFAQEFADAISVSLHGTRVRVLPLSRIIKSKTFVGRPKDRAHLPLLKQTLALRKRASSRSRPRQ